MLGREVESHLKEVIIPFWKKMRDNTYGGYYGLMDYELNVERRAVKGCILNSRILWFFSNAYVLLQDASLLEEANHGYEFLRNHCLDRKNGGVYWSLSYDGSVEEGIKHTYNQAFAIYALSSYYEASGKDEALQFAWELYHLIEEKCFDGIGYLEAFDETFLPISNDKLSENGIIAEKTMNTLLHVFEAYSELYRVTQSAVLADKLKMLLEIFAEKVYNPKLKRQEVFFNKDWNSLIDLYSYGHDIETAWLIDRGCELLGDPILTNKMGDITKVLTRRIYEVAYHKHSLWNEAEDGVAKKNRIWWVQAEAMVGFYNGYEKEPSCTEYLQAVEDIWDYIKNVMLDKRTGSEWFWEVDDEGHPNEDKPIVEPWKCPYHNGRMCFEIIRRTSHVAQSIL